MIQFSPERPAQALLGPSLENDSMDNPADHQSTASSALDSHTVLDGTLDQVLKIDQPLEYLLISFL